MNLQCARYTKLAVVVSLLVSGQFISRAYAHCQDARDVCEAAKLALSSTLTGCSSQIRDGSGSGVGQQVWSGIKCYDDNPVSSTKFKHGSPGCTPEDYVAVGKAALSGNCNQLPP
jgi:hypothetical protein